MERSERREPFYLDRISLTMEKSATSLIATFDDSRRPRVVTRSELFSSRARLPCKRRLRLQAQPLAGQYNPYRYEQKAAAETSQDVLFSKAPIGAAGLNALSLVRQWKPSRIGK
jgi:hypothetical protein